MLLRIQAMQRQQRTNFLEIIQIHGSHYAEPLQDFLSNTGDVNVYDVRS